MKLLWNCSGSVVSVNSILLMLFLSGGSLLIPLQNGWAQNTVSKPVGLVRIELDEVDNAPDNRKLASNPFQTFDNDFSLDAILEGQLIGTNTEAEADRLFIVKSDESVPVPSYIFAYKADDIVGDPSKDELWFEDFTSWNAPAFTLTPGTGFFIENMHNQVQSIFLMGEVVLDATRTVTLEQDFTLFSFPYSTKSGINHGGLGPVTADEITIASDQFFWGVADFEWQTSDVPPQFATEEFLIGKGYWYRNNDSLPLDWIISRPPGWNIFPTDENPPLITNMLLGASGNAITLEISTEGVAGEALEIYYKDVGESEAFVPDSGWLIAESDISVGGQTSIAWTDAGAADRDTIDLVYARYYLVARGDIDTDSDGVPDAREDFVRPSVVAEFHFDEPLWDGYPDQILDDSGYMNHGSSIGSASLEVDNYGSHGVFEGSGNYIEIENNESLELDGDLTIAFWYRRSEVNGNDYFISKNGTLGEFAVRNYSGHIGFGHGNGVQGWAHAYLFNTYDILKGKWHHVVITRDVSAREITGYLDGEFYTTVNYPDDTQKFPAATSAPVKIGAGLKGGGLDDVTILNGKWELADVQDAYDVDGDGMPNWWEAHHHLVVDEEVADGVDDADEDLVSNYEEYLNKTNPDDDSDYPGLVKAEYHFDEPNWNGTAPQIQDDSGFNNHGEKFNTPLLEVDNYGSHGMFEASDNYVEIESSESLEVAGDLTIAFWYRRSEVNGNDYFISKNGTLGEFAVRNYSGHIGFGHGNGVQGWALLSLIHTYDLLKGKWHHVVITRDVSAREITGYLDGEFYTTVNYPDDPRKFPTATSAPVKIGAGLKGGGLDDVTILNGKWELADVQDAYDADGDGMPNWWEAHHHLVVDEEVADGVDDADEDLVSNYEEYLNKTNPDDDSDYPGIVKAEYHFDEPNWDGTAPQVQDDSGFNNHGELFNGPLLEVDNYGSHGVFEASDNYIEIESSESLEVAGDLTIAFWYRRSEVNGNDYFISKNGTLGEFAVRNYSGHIGFGHGNGVQGWAQMSLIHTYDILKGKWHHVVITRDVSAREITGYLDGEFYTMVNYSDDPRRFPTATSAPVKIGAGLKGGGLDDVTIVNGKWELEDVQDAYDVDGDGMPNWWEAHHHLVVDEEVADGGGDADGDLVSNYEEYLNKTNPDDDSDYPGIVKAEYHFDELNWDGTASQVQDDSGFNNHGELFNGPLLEVDNYGSHGVFEGADKYIEIANSESLEVSGDLTIAFWYRRSEVNGNDYFISKNGTIGEFAVRNYSGHIGFGHGGGTHGWAQMSLIHTYDLLKGKWHHVVITRDVSAREITGYLDGEWHNTVVYPDNPQTVPTSTSAPVKIGAGLKGGGLDEVIIVNGVWELSDVQDSYDLDQDGMPNWWEVYHGLAVDETTADAGLDADNDTISNYEEYLNKTDPYNSAEYPGIVKAEYHFDELNWDGTAPQVQDDSGFNNHGELFNGPLLEVDNYGSHGVFEGADKYIEIANSESLEVSGDLTIAFWYRRSEVNGNDYFISKNGTIGEFAVRNYSGHIGFGHGGGTHGWAQMSLIHTYDLLKGKWHHVVITRDVSAREITGYLDGEWHNTVVYPDNPQTVPTSTSAPVKIGAGLKGGGLDEVIIVNGVWELSDVQDSYDLDQDGMPNWWEVYHGLAVDETTADATADPDGDLASNFREYVNKTDPNVTSDHPGVIKAEYHFEETIWYGTADEVIDDSGYGNHGAASGTAQIEVDGDGSHGIFPGTGNAMEIIDSDSLRIVGDLTVAFWYRRSAINGNSYFIEKNGSTGEFAIRNNSGWLGFYHGNSVHSWGDYTVISPSDLIVDTWQHVVFTRDVVTREIKAYLDGAWYKTVVYPDNPQILPSTTSAMLKIGDGLQGAALDEVVLVNGVWDATFIADYYTCFSDATPPVLTCPQDWTLNCDESTEVSNTGMAQATDTCDDSPVVTSTDTTVPGTCAQEVVVTRTWTATDSGGNVSTCDQVITVEDNTSPVVACPADVTVECGGDTSAGATGSATATDECDTNPVVTYTDATTSGTCPGEEVITRTWTATDACGNSVSCDQTVTVEDVTAPSITCPAEVTVECGGDTSASANGSATATDACDATPVVTYSDASTAGPCADESVITRTWIATDDCGYSVSCDQTIMLQDSIAPILTCPADVTLTCAAATDLANVGAATATDNCTATPVLTYTSDVLGSCPSVETRTWTATDDCGNVAECVQLITIECDEDSDADELPDCWEWTYFGHLDEEASDDSDGDESDNLSEYVVDSDPTDAQSLGGIDVEIKASGLTFSKVNPILGETVTLRAKVRNLGLSPAQNIKVQFSKFNNAIGSEQVISTMDPGGEAEVSIDYLVDEDGPLVISAKADPNDEVHELAKVNNSGSALLLVGTGIGAKIIVTTSINNPSCPGESTTVAGTAEYEIENHPERYPVKGAEVLISMDEGSLYSGEHTQEDGSFLQDILVPNLEGGYSVLFNVDDGTISGKDYHWLISDSNCDTGARVDFQVFCEHMTYDDVTEELTVTVANAGNLDADNCVVKLYDRDKLIGSSEGFPLNASESSSPITFPLTELPTPTYRVLRVEIVPHENEVNALNNKATLLIQRGTPIATLLPSIDIINMNVPEAYADSSVQVSLTAFYMIIIDGDTYALPVQGAPLSVDVDGELFATGHTLPTGVGVQVVQVPDTSGTYPVTIDLDECSGLLPVSLSETLTVVSPPTPDPDGDVWVTSENIFFDLTSNGLDDGIPQVTVDEVVNLIAQIDYTLPVADTITVTWYDIYMLSGVRVTNVIDVAQTINLPLGVGSKVTASVEYSSSVGGAHIIELRITDATGTTINDKATRILQVGQPQSILTVNIVSPANGQPVDSLSPFTSFIEVLDENGDVMDDTQIDLFTVTFSQTHTLETLTLLPDGLNEGWVTFDAATGLFSFDWDPPDTTSGNMQMLARVQNDANIQGEDENTLFVIKNPVDLALYAEDIVIQDAPSGGQEVVVTVHNNGIQDVVNATVDLYRYNDFLHEETVSSLLVGESYTFTIPLTFPEDGYYLIRAVVDEDDAFNEADEENNEASALALEGDPGMALEIDIAFDSIDSAWCTDKDNYVKGTVFYKITSATEVFTHPVAGAEVFLGDTTRHYDPFAPVIHLDLSGEARTDKDGRFTLFVPAQEYTGGLKLRVTVEEVVEAESLVGEESIWIPLELCAEDSIPGLPPETYDLAVYACDLVSDNPLYTATDGNPQAVSLTATIRNLGEAEGTAQIKLYADNVLIETQPVSVEALSQEDVAFEYFITDAVEHLLLRVDIEPNETSVLVDEIPRNNRATMTVGVNGALPDRYIMWENSLSLEELPTLAVTTEESYESVAGVIRYYDWINQTYVPMSGADVQVGVAVGADAEVYDDDSESIIVENLSAPVRVGVTENSGHFRISLPGLDMPGEYTIVILIHDCHGIKSVRQLNITVHAFGDVWVYANDLHFEGGLDYHPQVPVNAVFDIHAEIHYSVAEFDIPTTVEILDWYVDDIDGDSNFELTPHQLIVEQEDYSYFGSDVVGLEYVADVEGPHIIEVVLNTGGAGVLENDRATRALQVGEAAGSLVVNILNPVNFQPQYTISDTIDVSIQDLNGIVIEPDDLASLQVIFEGGGMDEAPYQLIINGVDQGALNFTYNAGLFPDDLYKITWPSDNGFVGGEITVTVKAIRSDGGLYGEKDVTVLLGGRPLRLLASSLPQGENLYGSSHCGTPIYDRPGYWEADVGLEVDNPEEICDNSATTFVAPPDKPYFSAVYFDPEGDSAIGYRIEVAADQNFANIIWESSSYFDEFAPMCPIGNGGRSWDIPYGGSPLVLNCEETASYFDRVWYWARMRFVDVNGNWTLWTVPLRFALLGSSIDSLQQEVFPGCSAFSGRVKPVGIDPLDCDHDGDGLDLSEELLHGTDPFNRDTDGDTYPDGWEVDDSEHEYFNPLNANDPPALVAHYRFNETETWDNTADEVEDASPFNHHGASFNNASQENDNYGQHARFDDDGDQIEAVIDPVVDLTGDLTISFWFKPDVENPQGYFFRDIVGKADIFSEFRLMYRETVGQVVYSHGKVGSGFAASWVGLPPLAVWHHIVVRRDTSTQMVELFVDGELKTSDQYDENVVIQQPTATSAPLILGDGGMLELDNVKIEKRLWSDMEIVAAYDGDQDRMLNLWEEHHHGPDPANPVLDPTDPSDDETDPDNDGFSNLREFLNGTDPNNENDSPGGMMAHYTFDEGDWSAAPDQVLDVSGQGNHGLAQNGLVQTEDAFGRYAYFDGSDSIVIDSSPSLKRLAGDLTIAFWFYPPVVAPDPSYFIEKNFLYGEFVLKLRGATGRFTYQHGNDFYPSGSSYSTTHFIVTPLGSWRHIVVTRDVVEREIKIYDNGIEVVSEEYSDDPLMQPVASDAVLNIGNGFVGGIEDLKFVNEVWVPSKIMTKTVKDTDEDGLSDLEELQVGCDPFVPDTEAPVLTQPNDITIACDASTSPDDTGFATASDNCDEDPWIGYMDQEMPGSCNITRTWKSVDQSGNEASADQVITIEDLTPPTLQIPPDITAAYCLDLSVDQAGQATASDNCQLDSSMYVSFYIDFENIPLGSGYPFPVQVFPYEIAAGIYLEAYNYDYDHLYRPLKFNGG